MTASPPGSPERARACLARHGIVDGFNLPVLPGYTVAVDPGAVIAAMLAFRNEAPPVASDGALADAMASIPAEAFWQVGHDGEGADPSLFRARIYDPMTMGFPLEGWGETPAGAIKDALSSQPTPDADHARGEG